MFDQENFNANSDWLDLTMDCQENFGPYNMPQLIETSGYAWSSGAWDQPEADVGHQDNMACMDQMCSQQSRPSHIGSADFMSAQPAQSPMCAGGLSSSPIDFQDVDMSMAQSTEQAAIHTESPLSIEDQLGSMLADYLQQDITGPVSDYSPVVLSDTAPGPMDNLSIEYPALPAVTSHQVHNYVPLPLPSLPMPELQDINELSNITPPHPTMEVTSQPASTGNTTTMVQASAPAGVKKRGPGKKTAGKQAANKTNTAKRAVSHFSCQQCRNVKVRCAKLEGAQSCERCTTKGIQCVAGTKDKRTNSTANQELNDLIDNYTQVSRELTVRMLCYYYPETAREIRAFPADVGQVYFSKRYRASPPAPRSLLRAFGDLEALRIVPSQNNKKPTLKAAREHLTVAEDLCQRFVVGLVGLCNHLHSGESVNILLIMHQLQHGGWIHHGPVSIAERASFKQQFKAEWCCDVPRPIWDAAYHAGSGPTEHDIKQFESGQTQCSLPSPDSVQDPNGLSLHHLSTAV